MEKSSVHFDTDLIVQFKATPMFLSLRRQIPQAIREDGIDKAEVQYRRRIWSLLCWQSVSTVPQHIDLLSPDKTIDLYENLLYPKQQYPTLHRIRHNFGNDGFVFENSTAGITVFRGARVERVSGSHPRLHLYHYDLNSRLIVYKFGAFRRQKKDILSRRPQPFSDMRLIVVLPQPDEIDTEDINNWDKDASMLYLTGITRAVFEKNFPLGRV